MRGLAQAEGRCVGMKAKKSLSEEMTILLRQLVTNGQARMAGMVLHSYCRREFGVDDETAAKWITLYFRREYPKP